MLLRPAGTSRVRAVFSWSYRYLDDAAARVFRLLGLHPGAAFEPHAVAALDDSTVEQASQTLLTLARAHLIQLAGQDRYSMHDLLRAYAAERANEEESREAKEESLTRLFDYYAGTTAAAMDTLFPAGESRAASAPKPSTPMPDVADADTARNWLAANLVTIVEIAAFTAGPTGLATRPAWPTRSSGTLRPAAASPKSWPSTAMPCARPAGSVTARPKPRR